MPQATLQLLPLPKTTQTLFTKSTSTAFSIAVGLDCLARQDRRVVNKINYLSNPYDHPLRQDKVRFELGVFTVCWPSQRSSVLL